MNNRADSSFEGWWYIVALILGLLAIIVIIWIVLQAKGASGGAFDILGGLFGR